MSHIAFALAMCRCQTCEYKVGRDCLLADGQSYQQHAIALGNVGTRGIDRDGERQLAVIDTYAPFIQQEFLDLLEQAA